MSRSRTRRRKSMWKLERPRSASCPQCGGARRPHRACPQCGIYRGREFPAAISEKE